MAILIALARWSFSWLLFSIAVLAILVGCFAAFAATQEPLYRAILWAVAGGCAALGVVTFFIHLRLSGSRRSHPTAIRMPPPRHLADHALAVVLAIATLLFLQTSVGRPFNIWFQEQSKIAELIILAMAVAPIVIGIEVVGRAWRRRHRGVSPAKASSCSSAIDIHHDVEIPDQSSGERDGAMASEIEQATPILVKMLVASRGDISVLVAARRDDGLVMTTAGSANDAIFQDLIVRGWAAPADIGLDMPGIANNAYAITPAGRGPVDRLIAEWETRMRADDLMIERLNRICDDVGPRIVRDLETAVVDLGGEGLDATFALSRAIAIFASKRRDPQGLIDSIAANAKNDAVLRRTGDPPAAP